MLSNKNLSVAALALALALVALSGASASNHLRTSGLVGACKSKNYTDVNIDLHQYEGVWFEIARSKSFMFDNGCECTTADYTLLSATEVQVNNTCSKTGPGGKRTGAVGKGTVAGPGKLMVSFGGVSLFKAPYEIVALGSNYDWAVVVSCTSSLFFAQSDVWILSRTPTLSTGVLTSIMADINKMGFDTSDLVLTRQQGCVY